MISRIWGRWDGRRGRGRAWASVGGSGRKLAAEMLVVVVAAGLIQGTGVDRPASAVPSINSGAARCTWVTDAHLSDAERVRRLEDKATKAQLASLMYLQTGKVFGSLTPAIPSLCLPAIVNMSARIGPRTIGPKWKDTTELPAPINLGASFDQSLAKQFGEVIGDESREQGVGFPMAPMINISRTSDFGRTFEAEGEDPYLMASVAVPEVDGIQSTGDGAIVDHCCVYNQADFRSLINGDDSVVSQQALREVYLPAWEAVVAQSAPAGIMTSYNSINGTPSSEDVSLLRNILRYGWGFHGFYRTDDVTGQLDQAQMVAATITLAHGGVNYTPSWLVAHLSKAALERLATPYLLECFRFGLIQHPRRGQPGDLTPAEQQAGAAVALRTSEEGTVLLRNTGVLPLARKGRVALIGSDGGTPLWAGQGSGYVSPPKTAVDAEQGLRLALGSRLDWVRVSQGPPSTQTKPYAGTDPTTADIARAVAAARSSKVAIVVASEWASEWWDQDTLALPSSENALIDAVARANPRTIVVVDAGQAVLMPWRHRVAAIVDTWYPGEQAGNALAAVLTGKVNPSGKLPITMPTSDDAQPVHTGTAEFDPTKPGRVDYSEGVDVGYRWYAAHHVTPAFPFGFGLSYSRFSFSHIRATTDRSDETTVTCRIANTSARAGAEVAQLYLSQPGVAGEPPIELRGFDRVTIPAHSTITATIELTPGDLAHWAGGTSGTWAIRSGNVVMHVGDSSEHLPLSIRVYLHARRHLNGLTSSWVKR
jgi:beta-glucosidase